MTLKYQPHQDANGRVIEPPSEYVSRMQSGPLRHWPGEVLREWLHRHPNNMEDYAFFGFEKFRFRKEWWELARVPGKEAFRDERFLENFENVEQRAAENQHDWLAHYMLREGTWNTPIVLFDNPHPVRSWLKKGIRTPYHLLEGHRRLSFLLGLKRLGIAQSRHALWIVHIEIDAG